MKGGRLLGRFEGMPAKGGPFLGQLGGALRPTTAVMRRHRKPIGSRHPQRRRTVIVRGKAVVKKPIQRVRQRQGHGVLAKQMKGMVRRVAKKKKSFRKSVKHGTSLTHLGKAVRRDVGKTLTALGKGVRRDVTRKLVDLGRSAGEQAVNAVVQRGKRVLEPEEEEGAEEERPRVKRRRLNPVVGVTHKKGYLSGTKQYGGSRLF